MTRRTICRTSARRIQAELLEPRTLLSVAYPTTATTDSVGTNIAVADFNGDGRPDVVSTLLAGEGNSFAFRLWNSIGNGQFAFVRAAAATPGAGSEFSGLIAADFDGDGDFDVLARGSALYLNDGTGVFAAGTLVTGMSLARSVIAGDVSGDGLPDLIAVTSDNRIVMQHNTGGGFAEKPGIAAPPGTDTAIAISDLNVDGRPDIVVGQPGFANVLTQQVDGTFAIGAAIDMGGSSGSTPVLADITGDGLADLAGSAWTHLLLARGLGDGTFAPTQTVREVPVGSIQFGEVLSTADLDVNGSPDLIIVVYAYGRNNLLIPSIQVFLNRGDGTFPQSSPTLPNTPRISKYLVADVAGDAHPDILEVDTGYTGVPSYLTVNIGAAGPAIGAVDPGSAPFVPGGPGPIMTGVTFTNAASLGAVQLWLDRAPWEGTLPGDGQFDSAVDRLLSSATQVSPGVWSFPQAFVDGRVPTGNQRFFVIASDQFSTSNVAEFTREVWTRVFYAEGFRNDASVNEYVSFANPNEVPVSYTIIARYENGDRDQVIASGTIAPTSRGGITTVEHGTVDLVRPGVGYALEVQSSLALAVSFSHYDNFGTDAAAATATGESFTNRTVADWGFADLSTSSYDFLLFYNPYSTDTTATVTFFAPDAQQIDVSVSIPAYRRAGLALRDIIELPRNAQLAARVRSTGEIAAVMTRYDPAGGGGFGTWGLEPRPNSDFFRPVVIPQIDIRSDAVSTLQLYNSLPGYGIFDVRFRFDNGAPDVARRITMAPFTRQVIDLADLPTNGATSASVEIRGGQGVFVQASVLNRTYGDSAATSPGRVTATSWGFGDGFMTRAGAGTTLFETLSVYNPSAFDAVPVTIRYLFTDGTFKERTLTVDSNRSASIVLNDESDIVNHAESTWYSIIVSCNIGIMTQMTHWDLTQRGGWAALGTPLADADWLF